MYAVNSYAAVCEELKNGFKSRYRHQTNVTGLIIAPSESELTTSQIIPHIERWFHRSDHYTDFFMGGYAVNPGNEVPDKVPVRRILNNEWFFSPLLFDLFVKEIEAQTTWEYSGDTDFILTAAHYDPITDQAFLDFSSAIAVDLKLAEYEEAILSVPHLFEQVFSFAKLMNEGTKDPAFVISDKFGLSIAKGGLKEALLLFLPESLRKRARAAFYFVAKDLSQKSEDPK